jgi:hypothetical protein
MQQTITFIPPDRGRACNGCTKCCTWLSAEAFGFKFGEGLSCTFLNTCGCSIYESRPDVCKAFQCLWKTDLTIPEWLKPDLVNVIMIEKQLSKFKYIEIIYADKPNPKIFDWCREQSALGLSFMIFDTKEIISNNKDFKDLVKVISKEYGV